MSITPKEVLILALGVRERFRCKGIARKPDARSWAIEQDFIRGAESALKLCGKALHPIILECHAQRKSITTLTPKDFRIYER